MKFSLYFLLFFISISLIACSNNTDISIIGGSDGPTSILISNNADNIIYEQLTQAQAKEIMDSDIEHIVLDVREQYEFSEGHIPGAILIPYTEIEQKASEILTDKQMMILVYCRSGRRSKIAAEILVSLGYNNVKEFGGINDWEYEIEY